MSVGSEHDYAGPERQVDTEAVPEHMVISLNQGDPMKLPIYYVALI